MEYVNAEDEILILGETELEDELKKIFGVKVTCVNSINKLISGKFYIYNIMRL